MVSIGHDPEALVWVALVDGPRAARQARDQGAALLLPWPDASALLEATLDAADDLARERLRLRVFERAFRDSPAWLEITDAEVVWWEVSRGFEQATGYRRDEVVGRTPAQVLRSGIHDASFFQAILQQMHSAGHWRGDMLSLRKDGSVAVTDTFLGHVALRGRPAAQFACRRHLRPSVPGSLYDSLSAHTTLPWLVARRASGRVAECHPSLAHALGVDGDCVGRTVSELGLTLALPDPGQEAREDLWAAGGAYEVYARGHAVGDVELVMVSFTDITDRKLEAEKLDAAVHDLAVARDQALAAGQAKSAFLAAMSHDLRTPLNAIIGYTELLEEELDHAGPAAQEDLARIGGAGRHLLSLVDDVLDLARVEAGTVKLDMDWVDGADLVSSAADSVRLRAQRRGLALRLDLAGCEPVHTDGRRVRQILINLLSNAVKYADPGEVRVGQQGHEFFVADQGPGLDQDQLHAIFQPFHRLQSGGSGVGLRPGDQPSAGPVSRWNPGGGPRAQRRHALHPDAPDVGGGLIPPCSHRPPSYGA